MKYVDSMLSEAFKISIEIDPKDMEGMHAEPEVDHPKPPSSIRNVYSEDSGKFGRYVEDLASESRVRGSLKEMAVALNDLVNESLDDLSLREDKREFNAGVTKANENVLRSWRAFVRELASFEKRFG